MSGVNKTDAYV